MTSARAAKKLFPKIASMEYAKNVGATQFPMTAPIVENIFREFVTLMSAGIASRGIIYENFNTNFDFTVL